MQPETWNGSWYLAAQSLRYTPTTTYASPPGQGYSYVPDSYANQAYGYGGNYSWMDDQRMHIFPLMSGPPPFVLGSTPTPSPQKKKEAHTTAVTNLPAEKQEWIPESTDKWDPDVLQTAAKEKKQFHMLIPFLKSSRAQPATEIIPDNTLAPEPLSYASVSRSENAQLADARIDRLQLWLHDLQRPYNMKDADYQSFVRYCQEFFLALRDPMRQRKYKDEDDSDNEAVASVDSDSDDPDDWRDRKRRKWGKAPPPVAEAMPPGAAEFQYSVRMTPFRPLRPFRFIEFKRKGALMARINLEDAKSTRTKLSDDNVYTLLDFRADDRRRIRLCVNWKGFSTLTYEVPLDVDDGRVSIEALSRRVARACIDYLESNMVPVMYSRVKLHHLEEIEYGVWQPMLSYC
ncbi:hypothetical protein C8R45DRAFT_566392 [Mycena sanguinolenta]|nr:hypothetical protein C8R45DRAFT_566392 [Mycena sanguinolenta]